MDINNVLYIATITGVISMGNSMIGFFKSKKKEKFDKQKFLSSIVLAFVIGFSGAYFGIAEDVVTASPLFVLASNMVENLIKGVVRR